MPTTEKPNRIGWWIVLAIGALLLFSAVWFVYAGPALQKRWTEARIARIQDLLQSHGDCNRKPTPHWLGLKMPMPRNPYLQRLANLFNAWQNEGGIPKVEFVSAHIDRLTPEERRQFYECLRPFEIDWLELYSISDADIEAIAKIRVKSGLTVDTKTGLTPASLRQLRSLPKTISLGLHGVTVSDAEMQEIGRFSHLYYLSFEKSRFTASGIKGLAKLPEIAYLVFSDTAFNDADLKNICAGRGVNALFLDRTQITDKGLQELKRLPGSTPHGIFLAGTKITDDGLKELPELPIDVLDLGNTAVSDQGMKEISKLVDLKIFYLSRTQIGNAGMKELAGLPHLEDLQILDTNVGDAGILELTGLKALKRLSVSSAVTPDGIKQFNARRGTPPVEISIFPSSKTP